jgi:hypothetical protein
MAARTLRSRKQLTSVSRRRLASRHRTWSSTRSCDTTRRRCAAARGCTSVTCRRTPAGVHAAASHGAAHPQLGEWRGHAGVPGALGLDRHAGPAALRAARLHVLPVPTTHDGQHCTAHPCPPAPTHTGGANISCPDGHSLSACDFCPSLSVVGPQLGTASDRGTG